MKTIDRPVVIIGAGVAGLAVAKTLSENGISSVLVEKRSYLGGHSADWACKATTRCLRCFSCAVEDLIESVESSDQVRVLRGRELASVVKSDAARYKVVVRSIGDGSQEGLETAALVIATGFEPYDPSEKLFWGYGRLDNVLTLRDLERLVREDDVKSFAAGAEGPLKVAFFQCVGSRDASIGANYCSQYCCKAALRMAVRLLDENPGWEATIFYIDLQIGGKFTTELLSQASEKGVRLVQSVPGEILRSENGMLEILRQENGLNVRESYHRIVLSVGQRPAPDSRRIAALPGLELDKFGFLCSRGLFDSSRTHIPGIYVAGTCGGPMNIETAIIHGGQTAAAVMSDLNQLDGEKL
jgi:heterodisulfide reductase subunit A2